MTALDRLRQLCALAPAGTLIPVESLRELLDADGTADPAAEADAQDLTLDQVAERVHRAPPTVRGWLNRGLISGAYKLRGRDWRIPPAALAAFLEREAEGERTPAPRAARSRKGVDLGAWRQVAARRGER